MTEEEWLAGAGPFDWPHRYFHWLFYSAGASDRKLRLACVACCRIVEPHSGGAPFPFLLRSIEELADGNETKEHVNRAVESIRSWQHDRYQALFRSDSEPTPTEHLEDHARSAILNAGSQYHDREWHISRKDYSYPCFVAEDILNATELLGQKDAAERSIIQILHDIFGNPFRPVTLLPEWRTSTVLALAQGIYSDRAFDRKPILADALQDSGCDNEEILQHCRGPGPHVRGCWVCDLCLGKQ
jgi:hypothetical protein